MVKKKKTQNVVSISDYKERQIIDAFADDGDWDDFESWEEHYELHERKDYAALVRLCEKEVARRPDDFHARESLGEAYFLNKQYADAITTMESCHREYPDIDEFCVSILDALFAMGKTENDFDWIRKPNILRLGKPVLDQCFEYLRRKRKPRSTEDIWCHLILKGYLKFSREDLGTSLKSDRRFVVEKEDEFREVVRVRRKGEA